eukprot:6095777-Pyramimonas_sp.AAC.4
MRTASLRAELRLSLLMSNKQLRSTGIWSGLACCKGGKTRTSQKESPQMYWKQPPALLTMPCSRRY